MFHTKYKPKNLNELDYNTLISNLKLTQDLQI